MGTFVCSHSDLETKRLTDGESGSLPRSKFEHWNLGFWEGWVLPFFFLPGREGRRGDVPCAVCVLGLGYSRRCRLVLSYPSISVRVGVGVGVGVGIVFRE